mgnify:CR=1 FL=1
MNQKNKDLPANAVAPFQNQFNQLILLTGFTKQEKVALEIFKAQLIANCFEDDPESVSFAIKESYKWAEEFCSYLDEEKENDSDLIMPV